MTVAELPTDNALGSSVDYSNRAGFGEGRVGPRRRVSKRKAQFIVTAEIPRCARNDKVIPLLTYRSGMLLQPGCELGLLL